MVGKHPNVTEATTYGISRDLPVFMSVGDDKDISDPYNRYLEACNAYFLSNYKINN